MLRCFYNSELLNRLKMMLLVEMIKTEDELDRGVLNVPAA